MGLWGFSVVWQNTIRSKCGPCSNFVLKIAINGYIWEQLARKDIWLPVWPVEVTVGDGFRHLAGLNGFFALIHTAQELHHVASVNSESHTQTHHDTSSVKTFSSKKTIVAIYN